MAQAGRKAYDKTYTTTGAQTAVEVAPGDNVTLAVDCGGSDVYSVQVQLLEGSSSWYTIVSGQTGDLAPIVLDGGIFAWRLNIATNASGSVKAEYVEWRRN